MKTVIILGSARKNGETQKIVTSIAERTGWDIIDLNNYSFSQFDYLHKNKNDDFLTLITNLITHYECFIFATPVYWYAMSGIMKKFLDRFTDLITIKKELGRKLRGKHTAVLTSSSGDHLGDTFWVPFQKTSEYLGMKFISGLHTIQGTTEITTLENFITKIKNETTIA